MEIRTPNDPKANAPAEPIEENYSALQAEEMISLVPEYQSNLLAL
jgi:hypothetical protein